MSNRKTPVLKRHPKGQAYVRPDHKTKKNLYLGPWGSKEAQLAYAEFLRNWNPDDPAPTPTRKGGQTVEELVGEFFRKRVRGHFAREDQRSNEAVNIRHALKPLLDLFGETVAVRFGPKDLARVRDEFSARGQARTTANRNLGRVRFLFRWAVAEELYPATKLIALEQVEGFRKGQNRVKEPKKIRAAPTALVEATVDKLDEPVRSMVQVQLLCGCRPAEICGLKPGEIDRSGSVWVYRPTDHKVEHLERDRAIYFGPKAQAILGLWLDRTALDAHCFQHADRPGKAYPVETYRLVITWACRRAFPHPTIPRSPGCKGYTAEQKAELKSWRQAHHWNPNQLRHTAATLVRARFGLEASQVVLGHAAADVTQVYAERDMTLARTVAEQMG